jgi:hypothetical protein
LHQTRADADTPDDGGPEHRGFESGSAA